MLDALVTGPLPCRPGEARRAVAPKDPGHRRALADRHPVDAAGLADIVTALAGTFVAERELGPLLDRIAEAVVEHTGADEAWLWMRDGRAERLVAVAGTGADREAAIGRTRSRGEGLVGRAWELDRTLCVADADEHPAGRPFRPPGTETVALPLHGGGEVVGLLTASASPGAAGRRLERQLALLERVAELASIAVANVRRVDAARAELARARALTRLGRLLSASDDPQGSLDAICRALTGAIDVAWAAVFFADGAGGASPHAARTSAGDGPERVPTAPEALVRGSIVQWCHESGEPARIGAGEDDRREAARVHGLRRELDVGATCCVPISRGGRVVGSLLAARSRARPDFDDAEAEFCAAVADLLSIALERHALSATLERQAHRDGLTGLPNRRRFELELVAALETALVGAADAEGRGDGGWDAEGWDGAGPDARGRRGGDPDVAGAGGAVMFLDLDGFKRVNDGLGHAVGDALLCRVAERLSARLKGSDTLARMGGDEFAVLVRRVDGPAEALGIAERLIGAFDEPFEIDGARVRVGTSVGIGHFPCDGTSAEELLRHADAAMYRAKRLGKGRAVRFDRALEAEQRRRDELELGLRDALRRGELGIVYQPQVSCATGRVAGVEALLRWAHPVHGAVPPAEFVPIAEGAGLIDEIGTWVLDEALRERASWRATALDALRVSVNVSASQFARDDFPERVRGALARHRVAPARLELEIAEGVVMGDAAAVAARLRALRGAGVRIAIDSFGTGHSSLSRLQDLPLDALKIDRAFVARLRPERDGPSLVNTIVLLASGLGLETVAEGVETQFQGERVAGLGCSLVQGNRYSRPVPAGELPATVRRIEAGRGRSRATAELAA